MAEFAKGPAQNGRFLNDLMNRSRISLNISPGTTMHMRALEIMGSGAFMLTRRLPAELDNARLLDLFEEGREVALFDDEHDLVERVRHYLDHPEICERMAEACYPEVVEKFSYRHVAEMIIDVVREGLDREVEEAAVAPDVASEG